LFVRPVLFQLVFLSFCVSSLSPAVLFSRPLAVFSAVFFLTHPTPQPKELFLSPFPRTLKLRGFYSLLPASYCSEPSGSSCPPFMCATRPYRTLLRAVFPERRSIENLRVCCCLFSFPPFFPGSPSFFHRRGFNLLDLLFSLLD